MNLLGTGLASLRVNFFRVRFRAVVLAAFLSESFRYWAGESSGEFFRVRFRAVVRAAFLVNLLGTGLTSLLVRFLASLFVSFLVRLFVEWAVF